MFIHAKLLFIFLALFTLATTINSTALLQEREFNAAQDQETSTGATTRFSGLRRQRRQRHRGRLIGRKRRNILPFKKDGKYCRNDYDCFYHNKCYVAACRCGYYKPCLSGTACVGSGFGAKCEPTVMPSPDAHVWRQADNSDNDSLW